ncbi:hypothetical protein ACFL6C_08780 [Myxococcota bacterium]
MPPSIKLVSGLYMITGKGDHRLPDAAASGTSAGSSLPSDDGAGLAAEQTSNAKRGKDTSTNSFPSVQAATA